METGLPVDSVHWGLAALPLATLLLLLIGFRWKASTAAPVGAAVAAAAAVLAFAASWETMAVAAAKGAWDALFILYVIWPALLLYLLAKKAGAFDALRQGMARFSRNDLFLVLAFGWVFASFLQGIAGFGTPIAVVAPLLVAIGLRPLQAVVIPLIGHAWATVFGTIAVTWLATERVIDMADPVATAWQTALLLWIPDLFGGLAIAWLFGRWPAVRLALPMIAVISLIHGAGQLALASWYPAVSNFIPSAVALAALYPLSRWSRYSRPWRGSGKEEEADSGKAGEPSMGLGMAVLPYAALAAFTLLVLMIPPIREPLERLQVGIAFPAVETGYGVTVEAQKQYSPFSPFTHPGFFLLAAVLTSWIAYRARNCFPDEPTNDGERAPLWRELAREAAPPSAAVLFFMMMSRILDHSGQTDVLALGVAAAAAPLVFAAVSNVIGIAGAFITSSSTASNVLFAPLQQSVAALHGLPEPTIIASQSAGGGIGNAVAPANVVLGTSTAGIRGKEGDVLRKALPWVGAMALLVGLATVGLTAMPV